jgi:ABC-type multidrug transport system fused ATPase/permease subunit
MSTFQKIIGLLTRVQRRHAALLVVAMLISAMIEAVSVGLVVPVMSLMMQGDMAARYPAFQGVLGVLSGGRLDLVSVGVLFLVATFFVKAVFLGWMAFRQASFAFGLQASVSERLFRGYLLQPYMFHLQRNSAQLIRNAINETNQFTFGAILPGLVLLTEILVLLSMAAMLIWFEPVGASVVILLGIGAGIVFYRITRSRIRRWGEERQVHEGLRIQHLQQGLGGAKEVKLLGRESYFLERYAWHNAASARTGELQTALQSVPRLLLEFLAVLALGAVVLAAKASGRTSEDLIPIFGLFSVAAFRLIPSANRILAAIQSLRFSLPVLDVLTRELNVCGRPDFLCEVERLPFGNSIELRGITFRYPGSDTDTLRRVGLTIGHGQTVGFVGESGAGKSTLINVILGLLEPTEGQILVDGIDVRGRLANWQRNIGYVPQNIYLTDDSLRRNIAFGVQDELIDEAALCRAMTAAQLDVFVADLPEGLDTLVGERGVRLSGGQRQRIGIARALYHAPVLLVLDEATSALDNDTERGVIDAVNALHGTITILIVAHRITTVGGCDVVYRLTDGQLSRADDLGVQQRLAIDGRKQGG